MKTKIALVSLNGSFRPEKAPGKCSLLINLYAVSNDFRSTAGTFPRQL